MKKTYVVLIEEISKETGIEHKHVRDVMDNFIDKIKELIGLEEGKIYLKGLGHFYVKKIRAKKFVLKDKPMKIPASKSIAFKKSDRKELSW